MVGWEGYKIFLRCFYGRIEKKSGVGVSEIRKINLRGSFIQTSLDAKVLSDVY